MANENQNMPAFPTDVVSRGYSGEAVDISDTAQAGLTKREYLAAIAMQGMATSDKYSYSTLDMSAKKAAEVAVKFADALLKELEK